MVSMLFFNSEISDATKREVGHISLLAEQDQLILLYEVIIITNSLYLFQENRQKFHYIHR